MKLNGIYDYVSDRVTEKINEDNLIEYTNKVISTGKYKDLSVRIPNDIKYALFNPSEICEWYNKYNCNDNHITTLFKKVVRENYPKAWEIIEENGR